MAKLKRPDVAVSPDWLACVDDGVEPKIPPPLEEVLPEGCPKLNPPDAGLLASPKGLLVPPLVPTDPKIEDAWLVEATLPNKLPPVGALVVVLVNRPLPPDEGGRFVLDGKDPLPGGA